MQVPDMRIVPAVVVQSISTILMGRPMNIPLMELFGNRQMSLLLELVIIL